MDTTTMLKIKDRLKTEGAIPFRPSNPKTIEDAESTLGFKIPMTLKLLYLNIGNGGFGPGYGLIGLSEGRSSNLGTLVETYHQVKAGAKYLGLDWQAGLLPFCEWGCNIFSCVDCNDSDNGVYLSEECAASKQNYTLDEFFKMWCDGVDILGMEKTAKVVIKMINPFTGGNGYATGQRKS